MNSLKLNFWLHLLKRIILSSNGNHRQIYKPKVHIDQTSNSADSNNYTCFKFNKKQHYNKSDKEHTLVTTHLKEVAQEVQINSNTTTLLIKIITRPSNVFSLENKYHQIQSNKQEKHQFQVSENKIKAAYPDQTVPIQEYIRWIKAMVFQNLHQSQTILFQLLRLSKASKRPKKIKSTHQCLRKWVECRVEACTKSRTISQRNQNNRIWTFRVMTI